MSPLSLLKTTSSGLSATRSTQTSSALDWRRLSSLSSSTALQATAELTAMNQAGYPADNVQLQGRYEGVPGQPGVTTAVQYTTVNISSEPPRDYIVWSLCSLVYANPFCVGLAALIHSIKARDRRWAGDLEGARRYGSTARCLNIWAAVLTSIMILIVVIMMIRGFNRYH